mmetsp:Transcript_23314/g.45451  ORF Transcript_23314/g.45451 Transcript_23314/m.45451 type:complete len:80 (+) Transcript_23314:1439-1678(+)
MNSLGSSFGSRSITPNLRFPSSHMVLKVDQAVHEHADLDSFASPEIPLGGDGGTISTSIQKFKFPVEVRNWLITRNWFW